MTKSKILWDRVPDAFRGFGAGTGCIAPSGLISLGDMINDICDKMQASRPHSKIGQDIRRKAVRLLHGAAQRGHVTLRFENGSSLPAWHWCRPTAERTIEVGVFCGPTNEAGQLFMYQPIFAEVAEFGGWLATIPRGTSKSAAVQSSANETASGPRIPEPSAMVADPYKTGTAGRPTISHLIRGEFDRRRKAGETENKLRDEAAALRNWAATTHPEAPTPTATTIENQIRSDHRDHRASQPKPTKLPTK